MKRRIHFSLTVVGITLALLLSGCAHFQAWGQKSSGQPGVMGGTFNFPIGK